MINVVLKDSHMKGLKRPVTITNGATLTSPTGVNSISPRSYFLSPYVLF